MVGRCTGCFSGVQGGMVAMVVVEIVKVMVGAVVKVVTSLGGGLL